MNRPTGTIFQQLRQRKLFQILLLYLGVGWGLAQVAEFAVDNYDLSRRVIDVTLFLIILGIPAVGVIGWYHGEKGHQRVQRVEALMLALLLVMAGIGTYRIGTADPTVDRDLTAVVDLGSRSVAVMPFRNRLNDPNMEWLSTGISELLTTGLAGLSTIRVVSGHRLYDLLRQEGHPDATEIPEALATRLTQRAGARFMVDGSVLGREGDLVMTADLVNVETGNIEASSRVRGADVFALVDSIAADLSAQIAGEFIEPTEMVSVASFTTRNPDAFREYLLGLQAERLFHTAEAMELFQSAVEFDSTFALAHIRLSNLAMNNQQISVGIQALQAAQTYREQAPERDQMFLDAIYAHVISGDDEESQRVLTRLVADFPDDKEARVLLTQTFEMGSAERGRLLEETIMLDPLAGSAINELAYFRAREGEFAAADSLIQRYAELEPGEPNPLDSRGEILWMAGRQEEARTAFREALALRPDFSLSLEHLARSWVADKKFAEGTQELEQFIQDSEPRAALGAYTALAMLFTTEGRLSEALDALDTANTQAAELGVSSVEVTALLSQLPFLLAFQDWDRLVIQSRALTAIDPLNPFPALIHVIGLAERGLLVEAKEFSMEILAGMDTMPQGTEFRGRMTANLDRDLQFYAGDFEATVTSAELARKQGGMPEFGNFAEVRAYLALGRYQEALDALRYAGGFNQTTDLLIRKHRTYYSARAYEGLADTTKAVEFYEGLLRENWGGAIEGIPLLADANDRLEALRAPE